MKKLCLLSLLMVSILLVDCSKDKNDKPVEAGNGLLAVYTMNGELKDSTGNIPKTEYTKGIKVAYDRKGNPKGAMYFDVGKMWAVVDDWSVDAITIACWVRPNNNLIAEYFVDGGAFGLYQNKTKMGLAISIPATNSALADAGNGWVHITGTYDGKDIRTYINGVLLKTTNHPGKPGHTQQINVGFLSANGWQGALDDLRFYNRVLSETEIAALAAN